MGVSASGVMGVGVLAGDHCGYPDVCTDACLRDVGAVECVRS